VTSAGEARVEGSRALVWAALFALYVIWGSTYYAMRVALTVLPPYLMAAPRFSIAGLLLFALLRLRGAALPSAKQWLAAGLVGILLLVMGNGFVALAERSVDSGTAATVVATVPLWSAAIGRLWGERLQARELLGLCFGFAGIVVLNRSAGFALHGVDALAILAAPAAWALGSVWSRRLPMPAGLMSAATQMIVGGAVMFCVAALRGERVQAPLTAAALGAVAYLVVFGSLIAFSAYAFLLRAVRPAIATSYAYVNPVVALGIGAVLGGERLTLDKVGACVLTVSGVLVVTLGRHR
jgi:drug/metabolite transporter (DMT)-like permease